MGFPPKSSILIGFSIINHPFWGTTILGNTHLEITTFPSLCWNIHHILHSKATAVDLPDKHYKPRLSRHGQRHMFQVYHQGIVAVQQNIERLHQAAPSDRADGPMGRFPMSERSIGVSGEIGWFPFPGRKKNRMFPWDFEGNFAGFFHQFLSIVFFPKQCFKHLSGMPGKTPKKNAPTCPLTKRNRAKSQSHWSLDKSILLYKAGILPDVNRILPYLGNAAQRLRFS